MDYLLLQHLLQTELLWWLWTLLACTDNAASLIVAQLKMVLVETYDRAPEVVLCEFYFPCQTFLKCPVYDNACMLDYMLFSAYNLLRVPLLCILDIHLAQISEIPGAFFTVLLQCQYLRQPRYFSSGLQLHDFIICDQICENLPFGHILHSVLLSNITD